MFDEAHPSQFYPVIRLHYKLKKPDNTSFIVLPEKFHNRSNTNVAIVQLSQALKNQVDFFRKMEVYQSLPEDVYLHSFFLVECLTFFVPQYS